MQRVNRIFRQSSVKDQLQTITSNSSHKSPLSPQPPTPAMHISAFHPIFSLFHSLTNQPRTSLEGNDIMNFILKIGALGRSSCYSSTARPSSQIFSPSSATFSPFQGPHNLGISPPLVLPFVIPLQTLPSLFWSFSHFLPPFVFWRYDDYPTVIRALFFVICTEISFKLELWLIYTPFFVISN